MTPHYSLDQKHVLIGTMHGKETIIGPLLQKHRKCSFSVPENFNTDTFGTFSGEVKRPDTQAQTALLKARTAAAHTGAPIAIGSEGSFFSDGPFGLATCNLECLALVDVEEKIEIIARAKNYQIKSHTFITDNWDDAEKFLADPHTDFPNHHVIMRPQSYTLQSRLFQSKKSRYSNAVTKGIRTQKQAYEGFLKAHRYASTGHVVIESDFRSCYHPTRQETIRLATLNLIKRLYSSCPVCRSPGRSIVGHTGQARCAFCHEKTKVPTHELRSCRSCLYQKEIPREIASEEVTRCEHCCP